MARTNGIGGRMGRWLREGGEGAARLARRDGVQAAGVAAAAAALVIGLRRTRQVAQPQPDESIW